MENLRFNNERLIRQKEPNLFIQTDASKSGWGTFCNGMSTGGKWSEKDKSWHINVLKLIAGQSNVAIHLQIDKKAALSYLLKMGNSYNRELLYSCTSASPIGIQTNCTICKLLSQCYEYIYKLRIAKRQGQFQIETKCFNFSTDCDIHGTTNSG